MPTIFSIDNLTYKRKGKTFFRNFNLEIESKTITSIIGANRSGKTTLMKIICAIYPTTNKCTLKGISLNKQNVLTYLAKMGVVTNDLNQEFLFKKVKDELAYPLLNLGYSEQKINQKINQIAAFFKIKNLLNKEIKTLPTSTKKKLLIIIALAHEPSLLVLDDAFLEMTNQDKSFMLKKLGELNKRGLTVLNITSLLDTIYNSQQVLILDNFQIIKQGTPLEILEDDKYLREHGLIIPFIIDLSIKLRFYKLIDKIYFNLEDLEECLWK